MILQEAVDELFEPYYMQGYAWMTIFLAFHATWTSAYQSGLSNAMET